MVAFAGKKYAARSLPAFIGNSTYVVTSFTLVCLCNLNIRVTEHVKLKKKDLWCPSLWNMSIQVLEFHKGTLQNLYWKRDGCASCKGKSSFVCLNNQDCAIKTSSCKTQGGAVDCSIGIQLAFSGTDKHDAVLNSWYEVSNLRQYSLFGLYSNLKDSLTGEYNKFF